MSWHIESHEQMVAAGYVLRGAGTCCDCGAQILFYRTVNAKNMPVDRETFRPHFATCSAKAKQRATVKEVRELEAMVGIHEENLLF